MKIQDLRLKIQSLALLFIACCLLLTAVFGCGYKFQGKDTLPFDSVKIGRIENKTYEPKLEDRLIRLLSEELEKNGIMISGNAKHEITGVIEAFQLKALSEKSGLAVEYEVIIKGKFFLALPNGNVKELRNSSVFIISFFNEGPLQSIMVSKESATESALKSLSSEIRAGITYQ